MTITGWGLIRFAHVLAAIGWVGGQLALSAVVLPVLRADLAPESRTPVVRKAAKRFALLANAVLLPTSLGTGLALAAHRHLSWGILDEPGYGRLFTIKMVLVTVSVLLAAVHGIIATRRPKTARPLGIAGLVASVGIVLFATALVP
jgi:uncharacterized membrane protein